MYADANGTKYKLAVESTNKIWGDSDYYVTLGVYNWNRDTLYGMIAIPYTPSGFLSFKGQYNPSWTKVQ